MLRRRNALFFSDVLAEVTARLPSLAYSVIATACAERLLTRHLRLPQSLQRPFTAAWRHPMDCIWGILRCDRDAASLRWEVADALKRFYDSPLNHNQGQDGPDDADHDAAAACIYAAESLVQSSPKAAGCAASRLVDEAFSRAADKRKVASPVTGKVNDLVEDCCHPVVQYELQWIRSLVAYVETHPMTHETVSELRKRAEA